MKARPDAMKSPGPLGVEWSCSAQSLDGALTAQELPFELGTEVNLDTHLDYLPLTLRTPAAGIFLRCRRRILDAYRESLRTQDFTEFIAPALVGGDAEGGAAAFKVEYFNEEVAYLATSPQFYKQIMVGPFERAFTVAKIFRAEKSATTRHLSRRPVSISKWDL